MSLSGTLLSGLYLASPAKPAALYRSRLSGFEGLRCFAQGVGSAIVAYAGAVTTAAPGAAPAAADFTSLDAFTLALLDGRMTGPGQMLAAIGLFLTAGHSTARILGLISGMTIVCFHMQGVTLRDALLFASEELRRLSSAVATARTAHLAP